MSWFNNNRQLFINEQKLVAVYFPKLHFKIISGIVNLIGTLDISETIKGKVVKDSFLIRITFPDDYPESFPKVFETGNKIPFSFHTFNDNSLCLGTEIEVAMYFYSDRSIINFIHSLLTPYLSGYLYFREYNELPFSERSHGLDGKLEHYQEIFNTKNIISIIRFLEMVKNGNLRGHQLCPCNSNKRLRNCHLTSLQTLRNIPNKLIIQELEYFRKTINQRTSHQ